MSTHSEPCTVTECVHHVPMLAHCAACIRLLAAYRRDLALVTT